MTLDLSTRGSSARGAAGSSGSFTYSINSQREERVNQGGQGSNTATIGHEPERTTSNAVQGSLNKALSSRANLQVGGDVQFEKLTSDAFNINPVNGAQSLRRPRVPAMPK